MIIMNYSYQNQTGKFALAYGNRLNVSWKQCNEVCYSIKGMPVEKALIFLEKVMNKETFVAFRRYNKGMPHRTGGVQGRYPVKAAELISNVLVNARSNAEFKGYDAEKLKVDHATAFKVETVSRIKPKGRAKTHNLELTNIEIAVREY